MRPDWNNYFMLMAKIVALRSTCNARKVGCVIVKDKQILSTGYNGSVPGHVHCSDKGKGFCFRKDKTQPANYDFCIASHAEANAVSQAAKHGISLNGSTAYVTYSPCLTCMKTLLTAGVRNLYYELLYSTGNELSDTWNTFALENFDSFKELRVDMDYIRDAKVGLSNLTSDRLL